MSTQPLTISQGALLPMPPDSPIQTDTGYTETPDSLTTTGYTDRPVVVHYPEQGANVQFPSLEHAQKYASDVYHQLKSAVQPSAEFLGNEVNGAGQMVMGLPSAIADSVTVAPTADEQKSLGVSANPSLAEKAALALYRNLGEPIQNAAQWYGTLVRHHQNIIDAIPQDVLAQGIGAGAGGAVLGKVLAPAEAGGVPVAGTPVAEIGKQLAVREHGEAGLPGTVGEPFVQKETATAPKQPVVAPKAAVPEPPDAPTFYSKAEQVINDKVPNNASGESIKALLQNNGVKADEMKWAGLDEFLKDKPKVSKVDLQQFISENQIQLRDVDLGKTQRFTTKPNVEETAHAGGEPMVDVIDPKNGQVRFTGAPKDAQDYMSELGQGLSSAEEFELNDLHATTHAIDQAKINTRNVLTAFGVDSPQYANAVARQRELVDAYTGGKDYDTVNNANNARIIELENKAKQGATDLPTKYDKWTLPGERENYQEKLLTLPTRATPERLAVINEYNDAAKARDNYVLNGQLVPGDVEIRFQDAQQAIRKEAPGSNPNYTSPHWGNEPNVVAHVRYSDRPAVDGAKTLFMEEAQSDWHSAGRHEGYNNPKEIKELARQLDNANDAYQTKSKALAANPEDAQVKADARAAFQETQRLERAYNAAASTRGVPDAPFKQSWHELAMKRMLRHAAENGYDRLAWTTGDQQADLYDLSKHIGKIEYDPEQNELRAYDPKGKKVLEENVDPTEKELSPYIGQEHAKNLVSQIENYESGPNEESLWDSYSQDYGITKKEHDETGEEQYWVTTPYGEDEGPFHSENAAQDYIHSAVRDSVQSAMEDDKSELPSINNLNEHKGGEFHRLLYDTMIPSFLKKYAKKWGAQVGTTEIKGMGQPTVEYQGPEMTEAQLRERRYKDGPTTWTVQTDNRYQELLKEMNRGIPFKDAMAGLAAEGKQGTDVLADHLGGTFKKSGTNQKVHSIEITPAMKQSVIKEGQPISRNVAPPSWQDTALHELGGQAA